ncbi:MAG: 50S ribosomal protein L24 [Vampirovibrionales bacterium]
MLGAKRKHKKTNHQFSGKVHVKKGDLVVVTVGKYKGHTGTVTAVFPKFGKATVEGVTVKKAVKPNPQFGIQGGITDIPLALNTSKLMIVDPQTQKPSRIRYQTDEAGKKVRVFVKTGNQAD